jgi:Ca-activated chloride channel family protein
MARIATHAVVATAIGLCALIPGRTAYPGGNAERAATTTEGRLSTRDGKRVIDVPLEHTEVAIHATGHLAEVSVEQRFRNPFDHKIEAVYLFPLPTGAAVNDLEIQVGDRVVKGEIAKRADAKATYVRAKKAGLVAALLTQERPNLFTQHVANLEAGATITVRMRYLEPLRYEDGGYEIVFPMVAPPRYIPEGSKQAADKDAVQPAVLPPETRSSHDIGLTVDIDAGVAIKNVASTSHQIVQTPGATANRTAISLAPGDTIPNKDFVLRYDVAGAMPEVSVLAHRTGDAPGSFFLTVQPPRVAAPSEVTPRELVFVVDTSSSMRGAPLAKARELVRSMLTTLAPDDTFQIVRFADAASALGELPIANKPKNVEYALAWLDALEAGGGTAMTEGIAAALDFPHDPLRLRLTVFITDGYVGNEDEILATVHAKLGASRLYSFGVGTAVNRYLLEEMASFGRGAVQVVRPDEDTAAAVATFHDRIAKPVLTDVTIDWGGLAIADATPAVIPDLFVGQPLVLAGHYTAPGTATVTVTGKANGRDVTLAVPVELPAAADRAAIATVWARARIAELGRAEIRAATDATRDEITKLALEHRLMSKYTAFVAVDRTRTTAGGDAQQVTVPVEVPAGLHATSGGGWVSGGMAGAGMSSSANMVVESHVVADMPAVVDYAPLEPVYLKQDEPMREVRVGVPVAAADASSDEDDYARAVVAKKGELATVARNALASDPDAGGAYTIKITVGKNGKVKKAKVTKRPDKAGADAMADKLSAAAAKWTFDERAGGGDDVDVEVPIILQVQP